LVGGDLRVDAMERKPKIVVYTTAYCPYCVAAKRLLAERGLEYEEIDVTGDDELRVWLVEVSGQKTVPQIFIDGRPIGGYSELAELDRSGELALLLCTASS
jgi:glutaredoxin 3